MFLQIGLGLLPAVVLLGVFAVVKRAHIVKLLYSAGVFATASATAFVCAGVASGNSIEEEITSPAAVITAQADKQFESAYALALNEDYSGAEEVLSDYCINGIHTSEFTTALARVNALSGNYEAAVMLYEKAGGDEFKAELEACKKALEFKTVDVTLGKINTTLYGAETAQLVKQAEDAFVNVNSVVTEAVSKEVSDDFTEAAELCKEANELYDSYILTGTVDETACEALKEKFDKVSSSALKSGYVRLSKLKVLVMTESYDEIAENADEYSDYNELMILSELYVNGYIEEEDFSSSFKSGESEKYDTLSMWLYDLMEEEYSEDDESRNYEKAEEYIEYFDSYSSKPALSKVKDGLEEYAQVSDASDRSKAYMELAKIETYQGNQSASDECMTNALNTVGICRDENYTTPVYGVIQIIENKEDNESLKNINTYVDDIITNSTTIKMNDQMYYQNTQEEEEESESPEGENEENDEQADDEKKEENSVSFDNYVSDFVSRKRSSLGILKIDTEKFPQVTATISVDGEISYTSDELKNVLSLKDCGENIANLSIKKLNYSQINFLLCCDTSGSMAGQPIEDLKSAVRMFLEDSNNKKVNYSLVTFTDYVNTTLPLGTDTSEIADTLDGIPASGGTNMYGAVKESLSQFDDSKALNIIVLLSDGADNVAASYEEIEANIGRICEDKNITIYSLGLGEGCNAEYLSRFSECTGGEYLYASGSETLSTFYDFIQNISANRYEVKFDAKNTTLESKRLLEIAVAEDDLVYASKYYSLNGEEEDNTDDEQQVTEEELKVNEGLVVSGFDTKLVYASDSEVKIKLLGDKFTKESFIRVSLNDILNYDIDAEYTSETEYTLTLPAGMACGAYDAEIIIDGKKFTIDNAITVALENGHETAFGKYIFTSVNKSVEGDTITLSGDVTMNGWLKFPGIVQLTGDFTSERIYVKPTGNGVISYSPETSSGLANLYSRVSNSFKIDMSNGFYIYKNGEDVEKLSVDLLTLVNLMTFNDIDVSVYPDRLEVEYNNFKPDMEGFDKLFEEEDNKSSSDDDDDSPFGFELGETKAYFTNRTIDVSIEITGEGGEGQYTPVKMGNFNYYVRPDELELKINTMEQEYEIKVIIQLAFLKDLDGFGFSAKWSSALFPEELMFYADYNLTHVISGVPITFSDFAVGASDMVYTEDDDEYVPDAFFSMANVKPVYKWTFSGRADISAYKAKEMLPGIEKYVGDVSLLTLDDTTIALHLGDKYMSFNTELKLIEAITLGKLELMAGHIPYENELLGLDESVNGFAGKATVGIMWEEDNVSLDVSASPEIAITDAFVGASVNGTLNAEFHWWVFEAQMNKQADVTIGFVTDNNDSLDFTVRARWLEKKGKYDGFVISWTGSELECDTKYYS